MPITSSGEIALIANIEAEFDQTGTEDISLVQAATDAGVSPNMFSFYGASDVAVGAVTTNSASSVGASSMVLNGNVTNTGGGSITSHGFYFGTSSTYSNNTKIDLGAKASTGTFNNTRTGLGSTTTYYITAFVVNGAGESVGATVSAATTWQPIYANMTANALATFTGYSSLNIGVYHDTAYSGSITTYNSWYNGANSGSNYTVPTATNANNLAFNYMSTSNGSYNKYTQLTLVRQGSRTFSNVVPHIRYNPGGAYVSASSTSSTQPYCRSYHPQSAGWAYLSSAALNYRYS
jgi:hypothetical protein